MKLLEQAVMGVVAIGLVTAFGLHALDLAPLTQSVGKAGSQVLGAAENG